MTTEQKAQAYDEAIERAKKWRNAPNVDKIPTYANRVIEEIFPELKESEDERIRKGIIRNLEYLANRAEGFVKDELKERIAWLEKQSEQKPANKVELKFHEGDTIVEKDLDECDYGTIKDIKDGQYIFTDGSSINIDEQEGWQLKTSTKVKPKFKLDDWFVYKENIYQIFNISLKQYYECLRTDGTVHTFDSKYIDSKSHLWTIQDAKDGDVLLSPSTPKGDKECPFIFKEIDENGVVRFHAALIQSERIKIADGITNVIGYANAGYHTPATKEQRDTLFAKMKEAGYEWDTEKKELKKIEQKPAKWSEEDEMERKRVLGLLEGWLSTFKETYYAEDCKCGIDWLESLKPQNHWKPTEAQLASLTIACDRNDRIGFDLTQLLQELKKL